MPEPTPVNPAVPTPPVTEPAAPVTPGTPNTVGTPVSTPVQPAIDVEKMKAEYEAQVAQYQRDINRMKSSFQKSEAQLKRESEVREAEFKRQLERIQVEGMDDDERKVYEQELARSQATENARRASELEQLNQELNASFQAYTYFLQNGVPADQLVTDSGYDQLFQSGWTFIMEDYQRLRQQVSQMKTNPATPAAPVAQPPAAPQVVTHTAANPSGNTWEDLVGPGKRFRNREEVYRLVESGRLSPSIIPGMDKFQAK